MAQDFACVFFFFFKAKSKSSLGLDKTVRLKLVRLKCLHCLKSTLFLDVHNLQPLKPHPDTYFDVFDF